MILFIFLMPGIFKTNEWCLIHIVALILIVVLLYFDSYFAFAEQKMRGVSIGGWKRLGKVCRDSTRKESKLKVKVRMATTYIWNTYKTHTCIFLRKLGSSVVVNITEYKWFCVTISFPLINNDIFLRLNKLKLKLSIQNHLIVLQKSWSHLIVLVFQTLHLSHFLHRLLEESIKINVCDLIFLNYIYRERERHWRHGGDP